MQNTSRMPAEPCKADTVEVRHNNDTVVTEKWGLTDNPLQRTPDTEDRPQRTIGLLMRGVTM